MQLFVEFHVIQNFVPSNLNRDDTGAPKDAIFGGHRRARVSSQCFKRAIRLNSRDKLPTEHQGIRTKKLVQLICESLAKKGRKEGTEIMQPRIKAALEAAGLKVKEDGKTEYLLFLGRKEVDSFSDLVNENWDKLDSGEKKSKKEAKAGSRGDIATKARAILDGGKAVDLAMFGRMLADLPEVNKDAACQVAHAISTHRVEREFDYFTAIDDAGSADETGAGMIGQVEFNSATFYRYAVVNADKLVSNLQGDKDLALSSLKAFTQSMAQALPTGKQNTFAAHNPPTFLGVVLRRKSPLNLANAFEKPVLQQKDFSISERSVQALADYEKKLTAVYGDTSDQWAYIDLSDQWPIETGKKMENVEALAEWVRSQAQNLLMD